MAVLCRLRKVDILTGRYEQAVIPSGSLLHGCFQHRRIKRISPQVSEARIEGFVKTLAKYDIPVDDRFIADIEPALEDGEEIMTRMLREVDRPTAFSAPMTPLPQAP